MAGPWRRLRPYWKSGARIVFPGPPGRSRGEWGMWPSKETFKTRFAAETSKEHGGTPFIASWSGGG
eukprot:7157465-Pyramimonas_sp.AAC.1